MTKRITIKTGVRFQDPLPEAVDIAVVGGGVIGVFAALFLARSGQRVLLCEKGRIAGEQSSRNWGWIRQQGRDVAELPIMMRALKLWHDIDRETGGACGVRTGGVAYLSKQSTGEDGFDDWLKIAATHDLDSRMLTDQEVKSLFGDEVPSRWRRALYTPSDARAEPWQAVPAVADLAQRAGALLRENCAVRALDISAGRVTGLVTEEGVVRCAQVIVAAGAWSSLFVRRHNVSIPQLALRGTVARTAPLPQIFNGGACDEELAWRRREDGGYTLAVTDRHGFFLGPDALRHSRTYLPVLKNAWRDLSIHLATPSGYPDGWRTPRHWAEDAVSPFERHRVLEPLPDLRDLDRLQKRFAVRFPDLGAPRILNAWAGMIDAMPDVVPVVDHVPGLDGLILATGMSGHGFGIGPGYGEILANLATGKSAGFDMTRFRFGRFTDGSVLEVGPGL
ncbi:MAG: FAD-dependent oxidoreductase [Pseudomonadota bacterium]